MHRKKHADRIRDVMAYCIVVLLATLFLVWHMRLWQANLSIPFFLNGDGLFYCMIFKTMKETGWWHYASLLGGPGGVHLVEFPAVDFFNCLCFRLIINFTPNYAVAMNSYFLLSFPLTAITSLYVFRQFGVSYRCGIFGALLYAFTPYILFRGEAHYVYSIVYLLPLMILVVLRVGGRIVSVGIRDDKEAAVVNPRRQWLGYIAICLAVGCSEPYYAYFALVFLLLTGSVRAFDSRNWISLKNTLLLSSVILVGVTINIAPTLIYWHTYGKNNIAHRDAWQVEEYGLKVVQLILPVTGHRVPVLARLRHIYDTKMVLVNENSTSTLGMVGTLGFLALLGVLVVKRRTPSRLMHQLAVLNIGAVLLGTIGGFSSLFAIFHLTQFRCYNRISIYIAFFSVFAVVCMLEQIHKKIARNSRADVLYRLALSLFLIAGLVEETSPLQIPPYRSNVQLYLSDAHFAKKMEERLEPNSLIWQLPYMTFPEGGAINQWACYDHFRLYLHSSRLHWSYGTMRGREEYYKQAATAALPLPQMLEALVRQGYRGIYINRDGYADAGREIEARFAQLLRESPLVSEDNKLVFFSLRGYAAKGLQTNTFLNYRKSAKFRAFNYQIIRAESARRNGYASRLGDIAQL